ncbi:MAG: hypothetical protein R3278_00395 [Lysobacter spongiicola]|nr:hypothetical protein [Lysobacter spongiicola]
MPEPRASLWWLTTGPSIWAMHFLLCYVTAAVWCAKAGSPEAPLGAARTALWIYTAIALALILLSAWRGLRRHRIGHATLPHDADTPQDRERFLGFATLLLSGLSFVAVVYVAMAVAVIGSCR